MYKARPFQYDSLKDGPTMGIVFFTHQTPSLDSSMPLYICVYWIKLFKFTLSIHLIIIITLSKKAVFILFT